MSTGRISDTSTGTSRVSSFTLALHNAGLRTLSTAGKRKRRDSFVDQESKKKTKTEEPRFVDAYRMNGSMLGSGAFGDVVPCENRETGERVAVKIVRDAIPGSSSHLRVLHEVCCAHVFRECPTTVDLVESFHEGDIYYNVYKLMEGGDLSSVLRKRGRLTMQEASKVCGDVAIALLHMHTSGVAHRDVKPANILCERVGKPYPARLADFDLASDFPSDQKHRTKAQEMFDACGTDDYLSPEMVQCFERECGASYTVKTDIWSLGVTLYRMVFGKFPFPGSCDAHSVDQGRSCSGCRDALYYQIDTGSWSFPDDCTFFVSDAAKDLISKMLVVDPTQRISAEGVALHQFVDEYMS